MHDAQPVKFILNLRQIGVGHLFGDPVIFRIQTGQQFSGADGHPFLTGDIIYFPRDQEPQTRRLVPFNIAAG